MEQLNNDGKLCEAFGAMGGNNRRSITNPVTRVGTSADPLSHSKSFSPFLLSFTELDGLYRSSKLCEKVVDLLPEDAIAHTHGWNFGESKVNPGDCYDYADRFGFWESLLDAAIAGRLTGDGYVLLGIDDGQEQDQPVNIKTIRSIPWCVALDTEDLTPITNMFGKIDSYRLITDSRRLIKTQQKQTVHSSRVLRLPGKKLPGRSLINNNGRNDSVIQTLFDAFASWQHSMSNSASMLARHSLFKYKLKGLAQKAARDKDTLIERFQSINMGLSTMKALMFDADLEDAEFINQNYAGVTDITDRLEDALIAASGYPRSKLLGSSNSSAFSEGGLSDRYEWANLVEKYQNSILKPVLNDLFWLIQNAKDSPAYNKPVERATPNFSSALQLTRHELAELKKLNSDSDIAYINAGVLTTEEVRDSRFSGAEYNDQITLLSKKPSPKLSDSQKQIAAIYNLDAASVIRLSDSECIGLLDQAETPWL